MKALFFAIIFFVAPLVSLAQVDLSEHRADSLSRVSRRKADLVLDRLRDLNGEQMLFSIYDRDYYVIIKGSASFKEYYIRVDSTCHIIKKRRLHRYRRNKKILSAAFQLEKYHRDFSTRIHYSNVGHEYSVYFVIKDTVAGRYGEFWLPMAQIPLPLERALGDYLDVGLFRLAAETK